MSYVSVDQMQRALGLTASGEIEKLRKERDAARAAHASVIAEVNALHAGIVEDRKERDALRAEAERWKLAWLAERHEQLSREPKKGADYAPAVVRVARIALERFDLSAKSGQVFDHADNSLHVRLEPKCCKECKRPL